MKTFLIALRFFLVMTLLTGVLYPLAVTGIGQGFFSYQANGSVLQSAVLKGAQNHVRGSELLAQKFDSVIYFQARPSACDYGTVASGASNKGPTSAALQTVVQERRSAFRTSNSLASRQEVPSEMAFASGSGLDPHISPEAARMQVARVAKARSFDEKRAQDLKNLVERSVEQPQFGIFGNARVNVVKLNMMVDVLQ
ncbi:MAG: potassium-transporting ATPase subunit KdpC [Candidatus Kapaibacterium sp.]|nr:MAG: potassium-transporting ATPase subunit KdpC [Candidatus Kapabacteria bacterium]